MREAAFEIALRPCRDCVAICAGADRLKKRKKIRVAFRKNRHKRRRDNNLTHQVLDEDTGATDHLSGEWISGTSDGLCLMHFVSYVRWLANNFFF